VILSVLDLTRATLAWVEKAFKLANEQHSFIFPALAIEYQRSISSFLHWRADTLNGGAVPQDLFLGTAALYRFVLSTVPAFALGSLMLSPRGDVRPGEGIGVDIGNLHQYRCVIQALVPGNRACPLHTDSPRCCAVPPDDFCRVLPSAPSGLDRCTRETSFNALLGNIGVSQLNWNP
jgi:hypothetical protein